MPEATLQDPVPGTVVPSGALVSPGGPIGGTGANAWTLTTAPFTVPPVGSTVVASVQDTRWANIGEFVWAGGSDCLQVTAKTATTLTLLNPPSSGTQPSGDAGNLLSIGSDKLLYLPPSAIQPTIWSVRLRSLNALANPTMEVDQMNCGAAVAVSGGAQRRILDHWFIEVAGTHTYNGQQQAGNVAIPATTSFYITQNFFRATVTTLEPALGSTHYADINHAIEGPGFREILGDVFSVSLLVRSSIANLKFGFSIVDSAGARGLGKLCTLGAANTWTLIQLPNLPSPVGSGGTFPLAPGGGAAYFYISLAVGTGLQIPANDAWQTISPAWTQYCANGSSNFSAGPLNSTFDIAYAQLEPGSQCTQLIDKPFRQNYDECLRYFCKSYDYGINPGTIGDAGAVQTIAGANQHVLTTVYFKKPMAKTPTISGYSNISGAINNVRDNYTGADRAITGAGSPGLSSFNGFTISTPNTALTYYTFHYIADTGF